MGLNQNYSTGANYIPNYGYPVYQQLVPHQQYREHIKRESAVLSLANGPRHEELGDKFELWMWEDPAAVPENGYLTMHLNGLGRKAISAGWSIADYRPAYAIESYNDILHNNSDQWIITLHNPTPYRRPASFYLITKKP